MSPLKQKGKRKEVKAWAIYNKATGYIWGTGGVAAHPIQIFSMKERAKFVTNQPAHKDTYLNGDHCIIPVTIIYYA